MIVRLRLTADADKDISSVLDYGTEKFGYSKAVQYYSNLLDAFEAMRLNPHIGFIGSDYLVDYRIFIFRSHRIFYKILDNTIIVTRVLHHSQNEIKHLNL